jgi:hypothetical protein
MNSIELSLLTFGCIVAGIVLGSLLPGDKLNSDTKEAIRLGTGLIGTIAALVLGLLIASAKSSFDTQTGQIRQITANIMLLDVFLKEYGPETTDARRALRKQTASLVDRVWTDDRNSHERFEVSPEGLALYELTQGLKPATDAQRFLQARALQLISDTAQTRVLMFTQGQSPIPLPFLHVRTSRSGHDRCTWDIRAIRDRRDLSHSRTGTPVLRSAHDPERPARACAAAALRVSRGGGAPRIMGTKPGRDTFSLLAGESS